MTKAAVLIVLSALGLAAVGQPAGAVPLIPGNSLTVDGLTITITGCTLQNALHVSQGCLASDDLKLMAGSGPVATVTVESTTTGGDIFDAAMNDGHTYDLSLDLTVATVNSAARINSAALAITGSAPTFLSELRVNTGESVTDASSFPLGSAMNVDLTSTTAATSFSPQNLIRISKDIKVNTGHLSGTGPMVLTIVSQTFGQVPEPASVGLLLTGLAVLGALRRRQRA
jgi:hypothetical protein